MFRGYQRHYPQQPGDSFDRGLQHERTALAWERTSVATMVAGTVMARYAVDDGLWAFAVIGLGLLAYGALMLAWTGIRYDDLHGPLRQDTPIIHPTATRWVGRAAIAFCVLALVLALLVIVRQW